MFRKSLMLARNISHYSLLKPSKIFTPQNLLSNNGPNHLSYAKYNCWSCHRELTPSELKSFFCPCSSILPVVAQNNFFDLFEMDVDYKLDKAQLTKKFRGLMRKLHPDLFTLKSEKEKEYSSEQSSRLNKAYSTLMNPIERGLYLLSLENIDYEIAAGGIQQPDADRQQILMDILELNEFIDEITDKGQVKELESKLHDVIEPFEKQLEAAFVENRSQDAVQILSKMKYYQNVTERLDDLKLKFQLEF